jgi:hypothetical protein
MWRCVDVALTDVSEERIASNFRVKKNPRARNQREKVAASPIIACVFFFAGTSLPSSCLVMNVYSGNAIPAFRHHVTISHTCHLKRFIRIMFLKGIILFSWRVMKIPYNK